MKRIVFFASYNKDGEIAEYVVYYLRALKKTATDIIFIADNNIKDSEEKKLEGLVTYSKCEKHGCYDFGSYRIGFEWAEKNGILYDADEIVFCNDSCYGPVFPFENIFEKMDSQESVDFWGLCDSYEPNHHILSFFMSFRKKVFLSPVFSNFVHGFTKKDSFWDYVNEYERKFTTVLEAAGFRSSTYLNIDADTLQKLAYQCGNGNVMLNPKTICNQGMPLIKVKALNNVFGYDLQESPIDLLEFVKKENAELHDIIVRDLKHRNVCVEDRWKTPSLIVSDAKVVSFDVFDTLLARPFIKPTDLFALMEEELGVPSFCKKRIEAEQRARKLHPDQADVSLKQIYDCLGSEYGHIMQQEMRYESDLLFVKEDGKKIYDEAVRRKCKIIAISDMYLPKDFISRTLKEKGYDKIETIYLSNEANCCKGDGRLFEYALKDIGIPPSEMVHIGDNPASDKTAPEKLGIKACLKLSHYEELKKIPSLAKLQAFASVDRLSVSLITAIFAQHRVNEALPDPYNEIGYVLGGPLAVGYSQFIHQEAKKRGTDGILFVSRDGYAIREAYNRLFTDAIDNYYVQTSRKLILKNTSNHKKEVYRKSVFKMYSEECLDNAPFSEELYQDCLEDISRWAKQKSDVYSKYIDSLGIRGNKLMTVDMTTREYTSLQVLKTVLGDRIDMGMFSITFGEPCQYNVMSYSKKHWKAGDELMLMLQEEMITAPEYTAKSITECGTFEYENWNITEKYRIENYKKILSGIIQFVDDFKRLTAGHSISITYDDNWLLVYNYIKYAHYGDMELMKHIYHDDSMGKVFVSMYEQIMNVKNGIEVVPVSIPEDQDYYYKKNQKHLRALRWLIVVSVAEMIAIIALLFLS